MWGSRAIVIFVPICEIWMKKSNKFHTCKVHINSSVTSDSVDSRMIMLQFIKVIVLFTFTRCTPKAHTSATKRKAHSILHLQVESLHKAYIVLHLQRQTSKAVQKASMLIFKLKFTSKIIGDWSLQEKRTTIELFLLWNIIWIIMPSFWNIIINNFRWQNRQQTLPTIQNIWFWW